MSTLSSAIVTHCVRLSTPGRAGLPANPVWPARTAPVTTRMTFLLIRRRRTTGSRADSPPGAGRTRRGQAQPAPGPAQDRRDRRGYPAQAATASGNCPPRCPLTVAAAPDGGPDGRSRSRTSGPATRTLPGCRPTVYGGRREAARNADGVTALRRPEGDGRDPRRRHSLRTGGNAWRSWALMSKRCSKGQYGAYDRAPQGDLPAAVCIQLESGQFPLAVLGMVRQ